MELMLTCAIPTTHPKNEGYHDSPQRWVKGTTPVPIGWYAGVQYDGDMFRASNVLGNISDFYPGSTCYEVAGQ